MIEKVLAAIDEVEKALAEMKASEPTRTEKVYCALRDLLEERAQGAGGGQGGASADAGRRGDGLGSDPTSNLEPLRPSNETHDNHASRRHISHSLIVRLSIFARGAWSGFAPRE